MEAILGDVLAAMAMPEEEWHKLWPDPFTAMAIPAGRGREYHCTQVSIDAAYLLADQTWKERVDIRQTVARTSFTKIAFNAIGMTVASCRSHLPEDAVGETDDAFYRAMSGDYVLHLEANLADAKLDLDRHIPCQLFRQGQGVPSFDIGPVAFRTRSDWITRFVTDPAVLSHITAAETERPTRQELADRLLGLEAGDGARKAHDILSVIGGYEWVATVRLTAHESTRSQEKAKTLIGLAINALGLRFRLEDARRLGKAGDGHLVGEARLATGVNGGTLHGWSSQLPGLSGAPGALIAKMVAERKFLDAAGRLLARYADARNEGRGPHLLERWANALFWAGAARRDPSDFMAVVDYGCAVDGLSGAGGNAIKMTYFAQAALQPGAGQLTSGVTTVADAVRRVYMEGRNKLAHGEEPGLLEDLSETRLIGDQLAAALLNSVTIVLDTAITDKPDILSIPEDHAYKLLAIRLDKAGH